MCSCASLSYVLTRMSFQVHKHLEWETIPCHKLKQAFIYLTVKQTSTFELLPNESQKLRCHSSEIYKLWLTKCCITITFYFWKNRKQKAIVSKKIQNTLHNNLSAVYLTVIHLIKWVYTCATPVFRVHFVKKSSLLPKDQVPLPRK